MKGASTLFITIKVCIKETAKTQYIIADNVKYMSRFFYGLYTLLGFSTDY